MTDLALIYFHSAHIVDFVVSNPIDWSNPDLARRGGAGDQAGVPPTPSVQEFLRLLSIQQKLFTQAEYADFCDSQWKDWMATLSIKCRAGVRAKLYRNFYPSMIDSLHAWALLSESGNWDRCVLDSYADAVGKTDLTVWKNDRCCRIALIGPTRAAASDRRYKCEHRSNANDCMVVQMKYDRPWIGRKRWYESSDFSHVSPT